MEVLQPVVQGVGVVRRLQNREHVSVQGVGIETGKIVGTGGHRIKKIVVRVGANTGKNGSTPACSPGCTGSTAAAAQRTCVGARVGTEDRENR
jgi:hypothetical protein